MLCYTALHYTALHRTTVYDTMLHSTTQHHTILYLSSLSERHVFGVLHEHGDEFLGGVVRLFLLYRSGAWEEKEWGRGE